MSLSANFRTVFNNINSDLSGISAVLETKADATSIPSAVSQLENDANYVDQTELSDAISAFATTGYVDDGLATKQNIIDSENKLDYGLLSAVPDPAWGTLTGELSAQTDLQAALDKKAGKLDDVIEANATLTNGVLAFAPYSGNMNYAKIAKVEPSKAATNGVSFAGWPSWDSASIPSGKAYTFEYQFPVDKPLSTYTFYDCVPVGEFPEELEGPEYERTTKKIKYHDMTYRVQRDSNDNLKTYVNYAYAFDELSSITDDRDYFYLEALSGRGRYIGIANTNNDFDISGVVDSPENTWLTKWAWNNMYLIGEFNAPSGTKVYLDGKNTTISNVNNSVPSFQMLDGNANVLPYKAGGKFISVFNQWNFDAGKAPSSELMRVFNQPGLFQNVDEVDVDFSGIENLQMLFYNNTDLQGASKLKKIGPNFKAPDAKNLINLFSECIALEELPSSLTFGNASNVSNMFISAFPSSGYVFSTELNIPNAIYSDSLFANSNIIDFRGTINVNILNRSISVGQTTFAQCPVLTGFNGTINAQAASGVVSMFSNCPNLEEVNGALNMGTWNGRHFLQNFNAMFANCPKLRTVNCSGLKSEGTANGALNTRYMFYNDSALTGIPGGLEISGAILYTYQNNHSADNMFYNCISLISLPDDFNPAVMQGDTMFYNCQSLTGINIDTSRSFSNVARIYSNTTLDSMFENCRELTRTNQTIWAVRGATTAKSMFKNCFKLTDCPEFENNFADFITDTNQMFAMCSKLSGLPANLTFPNASGMVGTFITCTSLSSLPDGFAAPLATDSQYMLYNCQQLSALPDGFNLSSTQNAASMFQYDNNLSTIGNNVQIANGPSATSTDNSLLTGCPITTIGTDFKYFTNVSFPGTWNYSLGPRNVFPNATYVGSGWAIYDHYDGEPVPANDRFLSFEPNQNNSTLYAGASSARSIDVSTDNQQTWTTVNIDTYDPAQDNKTVLATGVNTGTKVYLRGDAAGDNSIEFKTNSGETWNVNGNVLSIWDSALTGKTIDASQYLFGDTVKSISADISCLSSTELMFKTRTGMNEALTDVESLTGFIQGSPQPALTTKKMFNNCVNLSSIYDRFMCYNSKDMSDMFNNCSSLVTPPMELNDYNSENDSHMFYGCTSLTGVPTNVFCWAVKDSSYMFANCYSLTKLPLFLQGQQSLDTSRMFQACSSLVELPSYFSCPSSLNTRSMFDNCFALTGVNTGFRCPNTENTIYMFDDCYALTYLPDGFEIPNALSASNMFYNCSSLIELPSGFDAGKATHAQTMFKGCSSLTGISDGFYMPSIENAHDMFIGTTALTTIGNDVKIANGLSATTNDNSALDKSLVTSIGSGFEWFTNATFQGTWDITSGINNVFPNVAQEPADWKVYDHYPVQQLVMQNQTIEIYGDDPQGTAYPIDWSSNGGLTPSGNVGFGITPTRAPEGAGDPWNNNIILNSDGTLTINWTTGMDLNSDWTDSANVTLSSVNGNDYSATASITVSYHVTHPSQSGPLTGSYCPDCGSQVSNGYCTNTDCHNSQGYSGGLSACSHCGETAVDATGRCFSCGIVQSNEHYTTYCEECGACDIYNDGHYDWHETTCSQYKAVCESCWLDKELENGEWVCTNPTCLDSPYYVPEDTPQSCSMCGMPLEDDGEGNMVCPNHECESSPYYGQ